MTVDWTITQAPDGWWEAQAWAPVFRRMYLVCSRDRTKAVADLQDDLRWQGAILAPEKAS